MFEGFSAGLAYYRQASGEEVGRNIYGEGQAGCEIEGRTRPQGQ